MRSIHLVPYEAGLRSFLSDNGQDSRQCDKTNECLGVEHCELMRIPRPCPLLLYSGNIELEVFVELHKVAQRDCEPAVYLHTLIKIVVVKKMQAKHCR